MKTIPYPESPLDLSSTAQRFLLLGALTCFGALSSNATVTDVAGLQNLFAADHFAPPGIDLSYLSQPPGFDLRIEGGPIDWTAGNDTGHLTTDFNFTFNLHGKPDIWGGRLLLSTHEPGSSGVESISVSAIVQHRSAVHTGEDPIGGELVVPTTTFVAGDPMQLFYADVPHHLGEDNDYFTLQFEVASLPGSQKINGWTMDLQGHHVPGSIQQVPDGGSSWMLLGTTVVGMIGFNRRRPRQQS